MKLYINITVCLQQVLKRTFLREIRMLSNLVDPSRTLSIQEAALVRDTERRFRTVWAPDECNVGQLMCVNLLEKTLRSSDEVHRWLKDKLRGQPFFDLGSGLERSRKVMIQIAQDCDVARYVGVDYAPAGLNQTAPFKKESFFVGKLQVTVLQGDMLTTVAALRTGSANFVLNGTTIVMNEKYEVALFKELLRATVPGGVVFGYGMMYHEEVMHDPALVQRYQIDMFKCFEKR